MLKTICNANDVLTAIFVQCRPGSHMLSLTCAKSKAKVAALCSLDENWGGGAKY